ncbi:MAG: hypothetical protein VB674_08265 [Vicinamibacterales bacterium]
MQTVHGGQFPVARRAWWRYDCRTASSRSAWLRSSRQLIRARQSQLTLGGWANPHGDIDAK